MARHHGGDVVRRFHAGPDHRFRAHMGRMHGFRVHRPVFIGGRARFEYAGLRFGLIDPRPPVWFYSQAVYVDFIDGQYVLCSVANPGVFLPLQLDAM
jgi:hypothetical protein